MVPPEHRGGRPAGHAALVVVQLCFGLFPIYGIRAMDPEVGFSPWAVAAYRVLTGALVLGGLTLLLHGRTAWIRREDLPRFVWCAILGIVLNQGFFLSGLARSDAIDAALMMCLIPVFTFAIAALVRQEAFRWVRAFGVMIAFAGTLPLVAGEGFTSLGENGLGNLLMALNTFFYAIYIVVSKPLMTRYPALVVIAWSYVLSLPSVPLFLWGQGAGPAEAGNTAVWGSLAFVLVFPTLVGYYLNGYALARVRASTTAIYVYMQPLITGVAAYFMLGEELTPALAGAGAALFLGIWLVARRPERRETTAAAAAPRPRTP